MPLDNTLTRTNYPRLASRLLDTIAALVDARRAKAEHDKASRTLAARCDQLQGDLFSAMGSAPVALCGPYSLAREPGTSSPPTVKTVHGQAFPLSDIVSIKLRDGRTLKAEDIASLSSGRNTSDKISINAG